MPRIAYKPLDLQEPRELVAAIRARRGGELNNLDRMLLHSPPLASAWNVFFRAVRTELSLSPKLGELAICTVAILNGAEYEFHHHAPEFLKAGGSDAQLRALREPDSAAENNRLFDTAERAVLRLTIQMTRQVQVDDAAMSAVQSALGSDQKTVELTATIGAYNLVSRVLVALGVAPEEKE